MLAWGALVGAAHQSWQFALLTAMMISSELICVPFTQTSRSIYEAQTSLRRDLKEKEKGECDPSVGRFNCSIRGWFYRRSPSPNTSDSPSVHIFASVQGKLKTWYTVRMRWKTKLKKKEESIALHWMSHQTGAIKSISRNLHRVVPEQEMPASKLLKGTAAIVPAHKA